VVQAAAQRGKRLLWLVESRLERAELHAQGVAVWPGDDEPLHQGHLGPEQLERASILESAATIPILAADPTQTSVISPGERRSLIIEVAVNQRTGTEPLVASLLEAGYQRGQGSPGTFEPRGDTLHLRDLWGGQIRLEFFGQRIERITREGKPVRRLQLPPLITQGRGVLTDYFPIVVANETAENASITFGLDGREVGLRETPVFYRQAPRLREFIRRHRAAGYIITASGADDTFAELLAEAGISPKPEGGETGWIWPERKRLHLTASDFSPAPRARAARSVRISGLEAGAILVHRDYGIGRYLEGLDREIDGVRRSYLLIEFARGDRLYLPIEQLDRLTLYEGGAHPTLSRLTGSEWSATLSRLKRVSAEIALELLNRYAKRELGIGFSFPPHLMEEERFAQAFPYQLTPSQEKVIREILADMEGKRPMDRLVAGDVGFGKTEVAWRAAWRAILSGKQVALIAPTTVLVEQHVKVAQTRFKGEPVRIAALSRFKTPAEQRKVLTEVREGKIDLVIGTHRLLSRDVSFADLGLIIVDEEQRFGVEDKERLRRLYEHVDALTLTATPIPRTLELGLGGIRPMSVIEDAPEGRRPVQTKIVADEDAIWREALERELERGGQVYVITPRIRRIPRLRERIQKLFPDLALGVAHGQLPERELSSVMGRFAAGELRVLLASTIVENGLDLPATNTILIEDPTLLGLAELYQLRGRVGRGNLQGYCYLMTPERRLSPETEERIQAFLAAGEIGGGLEVALRDLELRGSGNILGREQHGYIMGVGLALYTELLEEARTEILAGRRLQTAEALIDLPLETALPDEVAGTMRERIELYRHLEEAESEEELTRRTESLRERFGELAPIENLATIKRLKLRSLGTPVAAVRELTRPRPGGGSRRHLVLTLEREPTPAEEEGLAGLRLGWSAKGIELRLPLDLTDRPAAEEALRALDILGHVGLTEQATRA
jgi:transcription-repair coupling factor (superfamily II helicase)